MGVFIVRHAESTANINGRTLSHASIPLSENGLNQARCLIQRLPPIEKVITSKYLRTHQTAQPIVDHYDAEIEVDRYLHEFSYLSEAKCANTTLEERKAWVDEYWEKMAVDYLDAIDAESFQDFYTRVEKFAQKLNELSGKYTSKHLLIVSHGQFIQLLIMYINQKRELNAELMQEFRHALKTHPIKNTEIFSYSLNGIAVFTEDEFRLEKSKESPSI